MDLDDAGREARADMTAIGHVARNGSRASESPALDVEQSGGFNVSAIENGAARALYLATRELQRANLHFQRTGIIHGDADASHTGS